MPGDQFGVTTQGPMSVSLVTDGSIVDLGFYAEITVSDSPPVVPEEDLLSKSSPL